MRSILSVQSNKNNSSVTQKKAVQKGVNLNLKGKQAVASPYVKKLKRYVKQGLKSILLSSTFHSSFKVVATVSVVVLMLYGSYLYIGKTFANEVVISQSEIVARVDKLVTLPKEEPYEIVRVQDEEDLRKQNSFYKNIKEGDYILMYKNIAIIYDLRNNSIVGIKRD